MKRVSEYIAVLAVLTFCTMLACKSEPGGGGDPTPVPDTTAVPVPTEVQPQPTTPPEPVPTSAGPCRAASFPKTFHGDCQPSPTCVGPDSKGFFYGTSCEQVPAP